MQYIKLYRIAHEAYDSHASLSGTSRVWFDRQRALLWKSPIVGQKM